MANQDTPFGLRPVRYRNGAAYTGAVNPYYVPAADTTIGIFIGDPVTLTGTSNTAEVSAPGVGTFPIATLPRVTIATAGTGARITGVVVAVAALPTGLETQYRVNSTERILWVCDDPNVVFEIQADSATDLAATSVGAAFNLVNTHTGNTATGISGAELDGSEESTDPQDQLIILRAVNRPDNDATLTHSKWEVIISTHTFLPEGPVANDGLQGV